MKFKSPVFFVFGVLVCIAVLFIGRQTRDRIPQSEKADPVTVSFILGNSVQSLKATHYELKPTGVVVYVDSMIIPTAPDTFWTSDPMNHLKQKPLRNGNLYGYVKTHTMQPPRRYFVPNTMLFWIE